MSRGFGQPYRFAWDAIGFPTDGKAPSMNNLLDARLPRHLVYRLRDTGHDALDLPDYYHKGDATDPTPIRSLEASRRTRETGLR